MRIVIPRPTEPAVQAAPSLEKFVKWQVVAEQRCCGRTAIWAAVARGELPTMERCGRLVGWWPATLRKAGVPGFGG